MWIIQYFDWGGTIDELEKFDKMIEKASEKAEGVKYKGRFGPHNAKYHWVYLYKVESYNHFMNTKWPERDYNKMTHLVIEVFG
jgi:hypothetical protein